MSGSQDRPFSVIPQSLRDAAALQAAARKVNVADDADCCRESSAACGRSDVEETFAEAGEIVDGFDSCNARGVGASAPLDRYGIPQDATLEERLALVQRMMEREAASRVGARHTREKSLLHGVLQGFVDSLFEGDSERRVKRLDVVVAADSADLSPDLMEIIELLPPGTYTRQRLCSQLNSAIGAHAWSHKYGMVR